MRSWPPPPSILTSEAAREAWVACRPMLMRDTDAPLLVVYCQLVERVRGNGATEADRAAVHEVGLMLRLSPSAHEWLGLAAQVNEAMALHEPHNASMGAIH